MPGEPGEVQRTADEGPSLLLLTGVVLSLILILAIGGQLVNPRASAGTFETGQAQVSLVAAYLSGLLAFLSPCSVAVIPGFFAYGFEERGNLVRQTYVFYLGLALVFVPLGFGASLVGELLKAYQQPLFLVAGGLMILLGLVTAFGVDLTGGRGAAAGAWAREATSETGEVFLLGVLFGLATSSCTAPIIAAVGVLSVGAGLSPVLSVVLFLVFALGIVTPLFGMAWAEDRRGYLDRLRGRTWTVELSGREFTFHSSKLASGLVLVALGVLFIATNAGRGLLQIYSDMGLTSMYESADAWIQVYLGGAAGWALSAALVAVAAWAWRRSSRNG